MDWSFYTSRPTVAASRGCYYGPMIDVELVMSEAFTHKTDWEGLRQRVLSTFVTTDVKATQTREVLLRTMNSPLGAIFQQLFSTKNDLQVLICEKRNALDIERELQDTNLIFVRKIPELVANGVQQQYLDLLVSAIKSNSAIMRVAGKAATLLLVSYIEMAAA